MVCLGYDAGSFQVGVQRRDDPYSCQVLLVCCCEVFLVVIECLGPIAYRAVTSVFLSLKMYKTYLSFASNSIECVPLLCSR